MYISLICHEKKTVLQNPYCHSIYISIVNVYEIEINVIRVLTLNLTQCYTILSTNQYQIRIHTIYGMVCVCRSMKALYINFESK